MQNKIEAFCKTVRLAKISLCFAIFSSLFISVDALAVENPRNPFSTTSNSLIDSTNILENEILRLEVDQPPYISRYVFKSTGAVLHGYLGDTAISAQLFYQGSFLDIAPSVDSLSLKNDRIIQHMKIENGSTMAANFDLTYILSGSRVQVVFDHITEFGDYKLLNVRSDFLTVRGDQPGAKLVFPHHDGALIDIATTTEGYEDIVGFGGAQRPLLMSSLYFDSLASLVSYDHADLTLFTRVYDHSLEGRLGSIGMQFNFRYAPTNFSAATFVDVFDDVTTALTFNIDFFNDYDNDQDIDWMDCAKYLRDQLDITPSDFHKSQLMGFLNLFAGTFNDLEVSNLLRLFEMLQNLTDQQATTLNIAGATNFSFFAIFGVPGEMSWISSEEMKSLFTLAKEKYNTHLTFQDNYSDYTSDMPGYDPRLRVIDQAGNPSLGFPIPGVDVFSLDPYDYAIEQGLNRVTRTLDLYPIEKSYHIDAFSALIPVDYSLESPSSRERNNRGLKKIHEAFSERGLELTVEVLNDFVGKSGVKWFLTPCRTIGPLPLSFNGWVDIPLLEFIYHGKVLYGQVPGNYNEDALPAELVPAYQILDNLIIGASSSPGLHPKPISDENNIMTIDRYYLIELPWRALNERFMENYEESGSYKKITYGSDSFVEIDYEANTYTVQVDGRVIAEDYATIYPKSDDKFLIYSRNAGPISVSLPDGWTEPIYFAQLTEDGAVGINNYSINGNIFSFTAEAKTPYRLTKLNTVPTVPALSIPDSGEVIESLEFFMQWGVSDFADSYQLQISRTSDFATLVVDTSDIVSNSLDLGRLENNTIYYWRTRAANRIGSSEWSESRYFQLRAPAYPKAVRFKTADDYIEFPHSSTLIPEQTTIEFWLRLREAGGEQTIFDKRYYDNWGNSFGYNIRLFGDSFPVDLVVLFQPGIFGVGGVIGRDRWYHIAVTQDATTMKIFVNGTLKASQVNSYSFTSPSPLNISSKDNSLKGDIDEVRIWNYARAESEIKSTMLQSLKGDELGLMAYWIFDYDGFRGRIKDRTSNKNNGLLFGNTQLIESTIFPPVPITLLHPDDGAAIADTVVTLSWQPSPATNVSYNLQVATVSNFSSLLTNESGLSNTEFGLRTFVPDTTYYWRVSVTGEGGTSAWSSTWKFTISSTVDVAQFDDNVPAEYHLFQNYPNPFNASTIIRFDLPNTSEVTLKIYNLMGVEVANLVNKKLQAGKYVASWHSNSFASGVYVYRIQAGQYVKAKKLLLIK